MSDADLYRRTSQYRKWSFTREQLSEVLSQPNRRVPPNEFSLDLEEEQQLIMYVAGVQTPMICKEFNFPSQVRATAISYFRKFYMSYSVMEYKPKAVLCTCVFLAGKSENCYVPVVKFCERLDKIEPQQILDLEFILFSALDFTLTVHNAMRPLHGFFLDMQTVISDQFDINQLGSIHDDARRLISDSFVSDACFLYTPSQIALAALMEVNELATTQYMATAMDGPNTGLKRMLEIIHECRKALRVQMASTEACAVISKKLNKYYKNTDGGSAKKRQKTE